jgi:hypothetical protein
VHGHLLHVEGDSWCVDPVLLYLGCIDEQGCGDAITYACVEGDNAQYEIPDTCLPEAPFYMCDPPQLQGGGVCG